MLADEALNLEHFPAQKALEHINVNIKQDQVNSATRMLLLEPSCIYATISLSQLLIPALKLVIHLFSKYTLG